MKFRAGLLAVAFVVATASFTRCEEPDKTHGWTSLFNGKNLEGWLCPALNLYFPNAPGKLFVQVREVK